MASPEPRAALAVEVFVKRYVVAPMRIVLEVIVAVEHRAAVATCRVAQKDSAQAARELFAHFVQVAHPARSGRAFDFQCVAVIAPELVEGADEHIVDREPDWPAPIRVAAE